MRAKARARGKTVSAYGEEGGLAAAVVLWYCCEGRREEVEMLRMGVRRREGGLEIGEVGRRC